MLFYLSVFFVGCLINARADPILLCDWRPLFSLYIVYIHITNHWPLPSLLFYVYFLPKSVLKMLNGKLRVPECNVRNPGNGYFALTFPHLGPPNPNPTNLSAGQPVILGHLVHVETEQLFIRQVLFSTTAKYLATSSHLLLFYNGEK